MDKSGLLTPLRTLVRFPVWSLVALLGTLVLIGPTEARARASGQPLSTSQRLTEAVQSANQAKGAEGYAAIRQLWSLWGSVDPAMVEHALRGLVSSPQFHEPVRAYAAFLAAHARTRRGDIHRAGKEIEAAGFVRQWLVVGPFDNEGKAGFDTEWGPEAQLTEPLRPDRAYSGKERTVYWRQLPDAFPFGWLSGSSVFRPEKHICYYAATFVQNPDPKARRVSVWVGVSGAFKLFINGVKVLQDATYRGHDVDRFGARIELPPGTSRVVLKACGTDSAPVVSLRFGNESGGVANAMGRRAGFSEGEAARRNHGLIKLLDAGLGPLDRFEKSLSKSQASPATLEAYARYLVGTHGDDPTVHRARDLAKRAAEAAPTVERLLLAGELSEDANSRRAWVDRAEQLARQTGTHQVEVALARAAVERSGINWREAFPHYARAMELAPDNIAAIRGRVELFNEAGMHRTALSVLDKAVERQPNSVWLLSMLAAQLKQVGDERRATEVEQRYARYRFDDRGYIADRLDLALIRNDRASATHWIERLLQLKPASLWARNIASRAYRRLNQPERAIAELKFALDLAPEDVGSLRALSDLHGELGNQTQQLRLLRRILEVRPQAKEVAEYVQHIRPDKPRQDEAYAWSADEFLKKRRAPANGENQRKLVDLNVTTVFENGLSSQFRQVVFQPLSDSAAALSRQYAFHYQADRQQVQIRGARVYRARGGVDEAIETGVGTANDPSIAMYTSARTYYVQFPRLEPGDVVELQYRIDDVGNRNEFADYFGDIQYLQDSEGVGHAEYVLITPISRKMFVDHRGIPGLKTTKKTEGKQVIRRFWATDVPPVVPEPAMPPWSEVLGAIHVSTYENYEQLGKWYWGLSRDQFDLDDETRKLANQITAGLSTEREKVAAVYNWVIQNTRYVALEFGIYGYKPRRCVQTVNRGWGDCKDKATVIVSLLKELGIESTIVIIRTQMRGRFHSKIASLAPFDHAIAYVPSLDLYLDGTAEFTGSNELPAMDQQSLAILVNEGNPKVVTTPLSDPSRNLRRRQIKARLAQSGQANLQLDYLTTGTHAPSWRARYTAEGTRRERMTQDLAREFPGIQLTGGEHGVRVELAEFEQPVQIQLRANAPSFARLEGTRLTMPVTVRPQLTEQYASLSRRKLAVSLPVFGTLEDVFEVQYPAAMTVESAPKSVQKSTPFGDFSVTYREQPGQVAVSSRVMLKKTRISPKEYPAWRSFCEQVDAAMSPRLVLKPKRPADKESN